MQIRNAEVFASLHRAGAPLLLANAWDVASAVAIEGAGAKAIATTSAGVAWSLGVPDAAGLGARKAAEVIARITAAVSVPVSADIEAGYGDSPDAVAATALAAVQAGAVGVNLEDRREGALLFETAQQADRLAAARAAARDVPVWINARTDVFLSGSYPSTAAAVEAVLERAAAYQAAGANSLFIPGLARSGGDRQDSGRAAASGSDGLAWRADRGSADRRRRGPDQPRVRDRRGRLRARRPGGCRAIYQRNL